jgi:PAS domain S-box-containing protein
MDNNKLSQGQEVIDSRIKSYFRDNTDFISTIFDGLLGYAIIAADFDGNVIAFNEGAVKIYGYKPEEIIGKHGIEILFPKNFVEVGGFQKIVNELISSGRFSYEGEKVRRNGEIFPARMDFIQTKGKDGSMIGFIEITEDITERKRAEEVLKSRVEELERFKKATIQRELRMKSLKDKIKELEKRSGSLGSE